MGYVTIKDFVRVMNLKSKFLSEIVRIRALWNWSVNHQHLSCRIINMCIYFELLGLDLIMRKLGFEMFVNHHVLVTPETVRWNGSPVEVQESLKINGEPITRISTVSHPNLLVPQISVPIVLPPKVASDDMLIIETPCKGLRNNSWAE